VKIDKFEDVIAWQKAYELTLLVYKLFRYNKDYSFKDQIQRSVVSIMNNIAEGYERKSNKEMKNFLYIAKGSSGEARSMSYLAYKLNYINKTEFDQIYNLTLEISRIIAGFIKSLK
jgi:four helix bundle protein